MHTKSKAVRLFFLSLLLSLSVVPQAGASDYLDLPVTSSMITSSDLDQQRTALEATVTGALANGQLTDVQADSARAKLCHNCKLQETYSSNGVLEVSEAREVERSLDAIEGFIQSSMRATVAANAAVFEGAVMANTPLNTSIANARFYKYGFGESFVNGGPDLSANLANFNERELNISAQLEEGFSDGRITGSEYFFLKGDLNSVAARTQQIADLRRRFTWSEQDKMESKLDKLQAKLNSEMSDNQIAANESTTM